MPVGRNFRKIAMKNVIHLSTASGKRGCKAS